MMTKFNVFKSIGSIKIKDKLNNVISSLKYILTQKKEILGTDAKSLL